MRPVEGDAALKLGNNDCIDGCVFITTSAWLSGGAAAAAVAAGAGAGSEAGAAIVFNTILTSVVAAAAAAEGTAAAAEGTAAAGGRITELDAIAVDLRALRVPFTPDTI